MAIKTEKESREFLFSWAKKYGCVQELSNLFKRYEDLLKGCKSEEEKKAIQTMGILEIHKMFDGGERGTLFIDGKQVK